MSDLTEKQRRFVEAYMGEAEGNATEAARLAGYDGDANTLGVTGHDNLRKPKIRQAIKARVVNDPLVASRKELQRFFTEVMRGDEPADMKDRLKAAELLGKTRAEFRQAVDVTTNGESINRPSARDIAAELADMTTEEKSRAFKELVGDIDGDTD